jgi:hypothetical protein
MKFNAAAVLLWVFPYLYAMELELDLVPLLDKNSSVFTQKKGFYTDNYKSSGYGCLPEKLYLARRIPGLISSKIVRKVIREYMIQTEPHLDYEIALHYQTKITVLHNKINELTSQNNKCPNIKIDVNNCIDGGYGAAAGGCCGALGGIGLGCIALAIKSYVWLWCDPHHNPIVCDALLWGFPICTGTGCVCGVCIGASGLYGKIEWV